MDESLGFDAWIVIGNALNLLLRGVPPEAIADTAIRNRLADLDVRLRDIQPGAMLQSLRELPAGDRSLLEQACRQAFRIAGAEVETLLGMSQESAGPVLLLLSDGPPHSRPQAAN